MTLAEYSIVIQWQLDDRLQWQSPSGGWCDWLIENAPCQGFWFTDFRRKPEPSGASDVPEPQRITGTEAQNHQAQCV